VRATTRLAALAVLGLLALGGQAAAAQAAASRKPDAPVGDAAKGKDVYLRYSCYACHGYAGHGGAAPRLVPMGLPLSVFVAFVRSPPTMPPYTAKVLSDAQLADVWAYIKTLPESRPASGIELLNQP
jgi:mono/diheme cytochrome c family protein